LVKSAVEKKDHEVKKRLSSFTFGFNGYENEPDIAGKGSVIDFGARIYDSRLGRFMSTDPIKFHSWSPYQYDANSPIAIKDILGRAPEGGIRDKIRAGWNSLKDKLFDNTPELDGGVLPEVGVIAHRSTLTGKKPNFRDKIRNVIDKVNQGATVANIWLDGFGNAGATNQAGGFGRGSGERYQWGEFETQAHKIYKSGQMAGDVASVFTGAGEFVLGAGGNVGSVVLDATGIGALIGVPGHIVSTGAMLHGGSVVITASGNLVTGIVDKVSENAHGNPSTGGSSGGGSYKANPKNSPGDFKRLKGGQGYINKETGEIWKKSHTSHGNKGNTGDQWKIWRKGTKDFGPNSKGSGARTTVDGNGNIIGN
jgi:RHS repeat-associated protein